MPSARSAATSRVARPGGREALAVVQKWPTDFNGAIVLYPAFNAASLDLQFGRITRALAKPGAYPSPAKRAALFDAAMQACDAIDGVKDGVIGNQNACNQRFDPATALLDGRPLRCPGGADTADDCLSDAQIAAFEVIDTPVVFNYPLGSGENQYPGFNAWGAGVRPARRQPDPGDRHLPGPGNAAARLLRCPRSRLSTRTSGTSGCASS